MFREEFPNRTTIYKNIVTDLGADPTGKVDAAPIINRAIGSCPVGQVVYMPAGTFMIATPIYAAAKSNFTLQRRRTRANDSSRHHERNIPIYSSGVVSLAATGNRTRLLRLGQQRAVIPSPFEYVQLCR